VYRPERIRSELRPASLGFVRRSGDAVAKLDWAGDAAKHLETFAGDTELHLAMSSMRPRQGNAGGQAMSFAGDRKQVATGASTS
jgi:hypothetical protein